MACAMRQAAVTVAGGSPNASSRSRTSRVREPAQAAGPRQPAPLPKGWRCARRDSARGGGALPCSQRPACGSEGTHLAIMRLPKLLHGARWDPAAEAAANTVRPRPSGVRRHRTAVPPKWPYRSGAPARTEVWRVRTVITEVIPSGGLRRACRESARSALLRGLRGRLHPSLPKQQRGPSTSERGPEGPSRGEGGSAALPQRVRRPG